MQGFCSNILTNTQCNGLNKPALISILFLGITHGLIGIGLIVYLLKSKTRLNLAWLTALEGIIFSLAAIMEASIRFNPIDLDQFTSLDKVTAALGLLSSALFFSFHIFITSILIPHSIRHFKLLIIPILFSLASASITLDLIAISKITYLLSSQSQSISSSDDSSNIPTIIRAGSHEEPLFYDRAHQSIDLLISFLILSILINQILSRLSKPSNHALLPLHRPLPLLWYSVTLLISLIKNILALLPLNSVVARRILGFFEYCAYTAVVIHWSQFLHQPTYDLQESVPPTFFTNLRQNSELNSNPSQPSTKSISPTSTSPTPSSLHHHHHHHHHHQKEILSYPPSQSTSIHRISLQSSSSLGPEDSASTAGFLPRSLQKSNHLRSQTPRGPHGSLLTPLRESNLRKYQHSR